VSKGIKVVKTLEFNDQRHSSFGRHFVSDLAQFYLQILNQVKILQTL
jgi:hypothetical protein